MKSRSLYDVKLHILVACTLIGFLSPTLILCHFHLLTVRKKPAKVQGSMMGKDFLYNCCHWQAVISMAATIPSEKWHPLPIRVTASMVLDLWLKKKLNSNIVLKSCQWYHALSKYSFSISLLFPEDIKMSSIRFFLCYNTIKWFSVCLALPLTKQNMRENMLLEVSVII